MSGAGAVMLALGGCSWFNMAPSCDRTAFGVQRLLAIPRVDATIDGARLAAIVKVDGLVEIGSAYNERRCSAHVTVGGRQLEVHYRVRQAEGLHDWYDITFLDPADPALQDLASAARAAYASDS